MTTDRRPLLLMSPALLWLTGLMVIPCGLILVLAFFRRGIYGGIEYTWTLENIALVFDPLYFQIFLKSAGIAGLSAAIACVLGYAAAYAIAAKVNGRSGEGGHAYAAAVRLSAKKTE